MHPAGQKVGICDCELHRSLLLCSSSAVVESCVDDILRFLADSGYPKRCSVRQVFAPFGRLALLDKIRSRQRGVEGGPVNVSPGSPDFNITAEHRRNVFFSFPFSTQANKLGICTSFSSTIGSIVPLRIQVAWSVKQIP